MSDEKKIVDIKKNKKILSELEMAKLGLFNAKVTNATLMAENTRLKSELTALKNGKVLADINNHKLLLEKERSDFNKELREKFDIKEEQWGYDPLTGEIK